MEDGPAAPKTVDVVIIPVAFKRNNELGDCLDRAREAKTILATTGLSCWTDMRRMLTPSAKYQDWESKGVNIRVEIGAQELRSNTVVVADLVTKTQHANGRMIATRTSVTLDNLAEVVSAIAEKAKQGKGKRGGGAGGGGNAKWGALLDMIDGEAKAEDLQAAAVEAAADAKAAKARRGSEKAAKLKKKKKTAETAGDGKAVGVLKFSEDAPDDTADTGDAQPKRPAEGDEDISAAPDAKKKRRRKKKKSEKTSDPA